MVNIQKHKIFIDHSKFINKINQHKNTLKTSTTTNNTIYGKYAITLLHQLPKSIQESVLYTLEDLVEKYHTDNMPLFEGRLVLLTKPMRKTVTIEQLATEQNYKGFDNKKVNKIIKDLAFEEPIEELLKTLTK